MMIYRFKSAAMVVNCERAASLKRKVLREPVGVTLNGKIQGFGGNAVEFGQVCIEHDLLAADQKYSTLDLNCQGIGELLFFCHF